MEKQYVAGIGKRGTGKRRLSGRGSAELENSTCPEGTPENLRTQSVREFSAKERVMGVGRTSAELE